MSQVDEYLREVSGQIRVKRIREPLMQELRDHMECQTDAYTAEGLPEEEAQRRAVEDMGDALLVGGELDRVHRPQIQWKGIILALFFMVLGLILQNCGHNGLISGKHFAFSVAAAGILLLVSNIDYTFWMKLTFPTLGVWLLLWAFRFHHMATPFWGVPPFPALYNLTGSLRILFSAVIPECICVAAPLLTAFLTCRLRSRKWGAFALCAVPSVMTAILAICYRQTGYNSNAMMLTSLCGFAVLFIAVQHGFQISRKAAYLILGVLCVLPAYLFLERFISSIMIDQPDYKAEMYSVLSASRLFGQGAAIENPSGWIWEYPGSTEALLPMIVHRFGWIPFILLSAAIAVLTAWLLLRFVRMKNRTGSLLGLSAAMTLAVQVVVYYLYSLTNYTDLLCLPLISYGNAMLIIDAILVGVILSALRGENLPEGESTSRFRPTSA